MTDDESLRIDVYSSGEQRAYALFWALRKQIEEINYKLNLKAEEYIVDGVDTFPLEAVLEAARDKASVYGRGGKRSAEKLLGDF